MYYTRAQNRFNGQFPGLPELFVVMIMLLFLSLESYLCFVLGHEGEIVVHNIGLWSTRRLYGNRCRLLKRYTGGKLLSNNRRVTYSVVGLQVLLL